MIKNKIIMFDCETTGVKPMTDRIVELGVVLIVDGVSTHLIYRFNPGVPIPKDASDIHGIKDEDVANEPSFADRAAEIYDIFKDAEYIGGYNSNRFDIPILFFELERAGIIWDWKASKNMDGYQMYAQVAKRDLTTAYKQICGKDLEGAHGAMADILATHELIDEMIRQGHFESYDDAIEKTADNRVDLMGNLGFDADGDVVYNIGKDKGKKVKDFPGFGVWMLRQDFPGDAKRIIQNLINKYGR